MIHSLTPSACPLLFFRVDTCQLAALAQRRAKLLKGIEVVEVNTLMNVLDRFFQS